MTMNEKRMRMFPDTKYFHYKNLNPKGNITGDCVIRAIAAVTGNSWEFIYDELYQYGKKVYTTMTDRKTYRKYLEDNYNCIRLKQPKHSDNTKVTCKELIDYYNKLGFKGLSIFAHVGAGHVVAICNESTNENQPEYKNIDIWDSSNEYVGVYYVFNNLNNYTEDKLIYNELSMLLV